MSKITVKKYAEGVESIYVEKPVYEEGCDGSDGKCDCIGMCRGGLKRAGATGVTNMHGTNQAARRAIENLRKTEIDPVLHVGDVVLKTRDKDNPEMPLPDKYRKGGSEYDPDIGEINFTHIGTVTSTNPLEITHMTSPTAKKDKSLKGWSYSGQLPWVEYGDDPGPDPDPGPEPEPTLATVHSENGKPVKMRAKPSTSCKLYDDVPCGAMVKVLQKDCSTDNKGEKWSQISYGSREGWYMMSKFLLFAGRSCIVIIPNLSMEQAEELVKQYPGAYIETAKE